MSTADHGLGRKKLPRDDRDYLIRDHMPDFEGTSSPRQWWAMKDPTMRIDQGQEGTCVGHGCTNVLMAAPSAHATFPSFADVNTAHAFARKLYLDATGDATYQQGAYTRQALKVLVSRAEATAYYRLATVDDIVDTLLNVGPVVFGSDWYDSMFNPFVEYNNAYLNVDPGSGVAGGHLYCLTGLDLTPTSGPSFVRMENSWGPTWGHNGTARIAIDDLGILYDGDAWVITETAF